ncbi:MAG: hypothetical protein CL424_10530 [Acidimicrobiaceae bacterium]|nr:hypothetical protein [Acidimicrobiaceae bacterium]
MTSPIVERAAGAVALGAMLATPFVPRSSRRRLALTWVTVVSGATRTWAIERRCRGAAAATATAGAVTVGTLAAEAWGVGSGRLFGRYAYTDRLRPHVAAVPVLVPLAWYAVALPARAVAHRALGARTTPGRRVGLGAVALTAWDLFLDPQMTAEGHWRWPAGGRYRGVPLHNYAGWLVVAAAVMTALERSTASTDDAHLTTYGALATLETLAFSTFWRDPLVALAGGGTMLPLTAAALAQRSAAARAVASMRAT